MSWGSTSQQARLSLFDDGIQDDDEARDEEAHLSPSPARDKDEAPPSPPKLVPIQRTCTKEEWDHVAVFVGADHSADFFLSTRHFRNLDHASGCLCHGTCHFGNRPL